MKQSYFELQSNLCEKFMEGLRGILENEKLNPNTRSAVKGLIERRMKEIEREFDKAFISELDEINTKTEALKEAEDVIKRGGEVPQPTSPRGRVSLA